MMAGSEWWRSRLIEMVLIGFLLIAPVLVSAKGSVELEDSRNNVKEEVETGFVMKVLNFLWQQGRLGYTHVWPVSPTFLMS